MITLAYDQTQLASIPPLRSRRHPPCNRAKTTIAWNIYMAHGVLAVSVAQAQDGRRVLINATMILSKPLVPQHSVRLRWACPSSIQHAQRRLVQRIST